MKAPPLITPRVLRGLQRMRGRTIADVLTIQDEPGRKAEVRELYNAIEWLDAVLEAHESAVCK